MIDERRLYMKQLIRSYRTDMSGVDPMMPGEIRYRHPDYEEDRKHWYSYNQGLDSVVKYIDDLEHKIDELQYVERIINAAKEN